jgi:D-alanine transaminase
VQPELVHLNGQLVPREKACVSVFDRGFLFGDGVYEGLRTTRGRVIGLRHHVERMNAGLREARIHGFDAAALQTLTTQLIDALGLSDAAVYWQVSRGVPPAGAPLRARVPHPDSVPTVFGYAVAAKAITEYVKPELRRLALRPDTRWTRGHLKSISLLGGVLAAIEADEQGCDDAVMFKDGIVTEGTATNVFIASGGRLATPSLESAPMLAGATRALILEQDPSIEVRPVTVEELHAADEIMLTGTYTMVSAGSTLDGRVIGKPGAVSPGPMACRLLKTLVDAIEKEYQSAAAPRLTPVSAV